MPEDDVGDTTLRGVPTLAELADLVGGTLSGAGDRAITGVAPVDEATVGQIAFLALRQYGKHVERCQASAYLVSVELVSLVPDSVASIVVVDPYQALRRLQTHFAPPHLWTPGVHPTAVLAEDVTLGEGTAIGPYAVLEEGVHVGAGTRIGAHCVLQHGTVIGDRTRVYPHVVVYYDTEIGSDVIIHSGVILGVDGFGYTLVDGEHAKMPQIGRCIIGDGVEIGANTAVDRGSLGDTRVGRGVKIDNLVHLAHNVKIGARTMIAAMSAVAGSTTVGKGVWIGGQSGVINQVEVGDGARIAVRSGVTRDIPAGETVSGFPAIPHVDEVWRRARIGRIPKMIERIRELEQEVERLKSG